LKEILLVGSIQKEDSVINDLFNRGNFKVSRVKNANKALKHLKQNSPDFVLCTGCIKQTNDGRFFLEL